jgi:hypothetical protein
MKNNTFFIVFREPDHRNIIKNDEQDAYGWEFADNIEIFDYQEAKRVREEYQKAMPNFVVNIRAVPIKVGLYSQSDIDGMRPRV